jgi:hypothetical protein
MQRPTPRNPACLTLFFWMFLLFELVLTELCAGDVLAIELLGPHNAAPHITVRFCCLNCVQVMCWPSSC